MRKLIKTVAFVIVLGFVLVIGINAYVIGSTRNKINKRTENVDCIIVLGCKVYKSGKPSAMLEDRLNKAIELYKKGVADKIIMSGDHGQVEYNEVRTMKEYAIKQGVPSKDIFMDHAGFSTYETVYRAKEVFDVKSAVIVTQKYHLYRSLFIAQKFGIKATGFDSDYRKYAGQGNRELREIIARCKDFVITILKPKPTYLGDVIPISGSGDVTND